MTTTIPGPDKRPSSLYRLSNLHVANNLSLCQEGQEDVPRKNKRRINSTYSQHWSVPDMLALAPLPHSFIKFGVTEKLDSNPSSAYILKL